VDTYGEYVVAGDIHWHVKCWREDVKENKEAKRVRP